MKVTKKERPDPRNSLNDLSNTQWMYFTRSVWTTSYPNELGFELRKKQGGNKPPRLMKELIEFFTKRGQRVLDPMSGVGGTLIGCSLARRKGLGIELSHEWVDIYKQVCEQEGLEKFRVIVGDCLEALNELEENSFDFVVVDPPYREDVKWDRTMCDETYATRIANVPESYSASERDFGNMMNYSQFLANIFLLSRKVKRILKEEQYFVVFSKDEYQNGEFNEKSSIMAEMIRRAGFQWKGKITWYQAGAKLRPYGVPYSYVPNITDQKILVFRNSTRVSRKRSAQRIGSTSAEIKKALEETTRTQNMPEIVSFG
jgi:DNA modification methylase